MQNPFLLYNFTSGTTSWDECLGALRQGLNPFSIKSGEYISKFESLVAKYVGSKRAFAFSAGRMALYAILKAIYEDDRDEVILPAYTCVAVPTAIIYANYKPVYVDIEPDTFNLSVSDLLEKLSKRSRAIIAAHNFGNPCEVEKIREIANERNIVVIEDCAHGFGTNYTGRRLGSFGEFSFISTDHTKVISTSVGGVALVNDSAYLDRIEKIYQQAPYLSFYRIYQILIQFVLLNLFHYPGFYRIGRLLASLFHRLRLGFFLPGCDRPQKPEAYAFPARLSNVQCWIGYQQMQKIDANLAHRRKIGQQCLALLKKHFITQSRVDAGNVVPLRIAFLVRRRAEFKKYFRDFFKVETWFDHVFQNFEGDPALLGYKPGNCPVAEKVAQQVVNFPTHLKIDERFVALVNGKLQDEKQVARFATRIEQRETEANSKQKEIDYAESL